MEGLIEGRIVHYVMPDDVEHRPAIIVKVWNKNDGYVNLTVFTDWNNDASMPTPGTKDSGVAADADQIANGMFWATSVCFDDQNKAPGTWHWIEKA